MDTKVLTHEFDATIFRKNSSNNSPETNKTKQIIIMIRKKIYYIVRCVIISLNKK